MEGVQRTRNLKGKLPIPALLAMPYINRPNVDKSFKKRKSPRELPGKH